MHLRKIYILLVLASLALGLQQMAKAEETQQGGSAAMVPVRTVAAVAGIPVGAAFGMVHGALSGAADNVTMVMSPMHPASSTLIMKPLHIILGGVTGAIKGLATGASKGAKAGWNLGR